MRLSKIIGGAPRFLQKVSSTCHGSSDSEHAYASVVNPKHMPEDGRRRRSAKDRRESLRINSKPQGCVRMAPDATAPRNNEQAYASVTTPEVQDSAYL